MSNDTFTLSFPLPRTHCGMVMGNGNFGVLLWGEDRLHITLNRADYWDHRGGELIMPGTTYNGLVEVARTQGTGEALEKAIPRYEFPPDVFKPQRLPVGRFELCFKRGVRPTAAVLQYSSGTVDVPLSDGGCLKFDLSLQRPVLFVHDEKQSIAEVQYRPAVDFPDASEWLVHCGFAQPERHKNGWAQACPADPSIACWCECTGTGYAFAMEKGSDNTQAIANVCNLLTQTDQCVESVYTRSWWQQYWKDAPQIQLPDDWYNRFFRYGLYKFAAATHPNGYACPLQGPWQEEYKHAEWSGDYHFNVNVQEIYGPAFACGKPEHLLPLFDMLESTPYQNALKHNARVLFGIEDGLWFTHALDDRGQQCGWLIPGAILDPACGAWTAQLYWDYYRYTADSEFLRNRAYPFMKGVMRGYEEMLRDEDGRLSIPLAISAEYGCGNRQSGEGGVDPSYQLAAAHMLVGALLEACEILQLPPKPVWLDIKQRLPQYTVVSTEYANGSREEHIGIWQGQDLEVCHRHHSHLAGIYPFQTLANPNPEQEELLESTIDHWILMGMGQWSEWGIPWAAILCSRRDLTQAPMMMLNLWREIFVNEGLATVYLPRSRGVIAHRRHDLKKPKETSEFTQIDGTMGAITALLEMLGHMRGDVFKLFCGIPQEWPDVSFCNLHLPGGFVAAATCSELSIHSLRGGGLKIDNGNSILHLHFTKDETKTIPLFSRT